jgi:acetyltransferase-like isoleucine patch superfamily enzyme
MSRVMKLFTVPFKMLYAKMYPERYAKMIGVNMGEGVRIYGSSYSMFSTEPWLVTLGNNVHIVGETAFLPHDGGTLILRSKVPDLELTQPITVGDNVYIGLRCLIMLGVHIGSNVIIGAGSIVTKDIPENSVAAGVPASVIKTLDEYLEKANSNSLHLGHLYSEEKARELKKIFNL